MLAKKFPAHRLARVADYSREDIEREKQYHEGNECLAVASGDFDGDKTRDFAFLLTSENGKTLLVAARHPGNRFWKIDALRDFGDEGAGGSYVNVLEPGRYEDIWGGPEEPNLREPGQVDEYRSHNEGIIAGTMESSGIAYFFTGKKWVHLWLSD